MGIATNKMTTEERRKYFLAKDWWPKRNKKAPSGKTFGRRFELLYGESIEDYRRSLYQSENEQPPEERVEP